MIIRVECDGCRAPYQVDDKRIPPAGLRMRCPKCSTTFVVRALVSTSIRRPDASSAAPVSNSRAGAYAPDAPAANARTGARPQEARAEPRAARADEEIE